jgi:anthranilate phosphoribosyltransferase
VIGAPSVAFAEIMAEALAELGTGHSYVVHGVLPGGGGLDEVSTTGSTEVYEVWTGRIEKSVWTPEDFGMPTVALSALAGGDAAENAKIAVDLLGGMSGPRRDIVLVNVAAGLMAAGLATTPREGVAKAAEAIDSGRAMAVLKQLQREFPQRL